MIKHDKDKDGDKRNEDFFSLDPESPTGDERDAAQDGEEATRQDSGSYALHSEINQLKSQLQAKDQEIAELKDKYLRTLADSENARRRIRQQSEESVRLQRENLLRDILPIVDNLERAVDAAGDGGNGKPIVEGVGMVLASLHDFLKNQGVTPHSAIGHTFDPSRHEAIDHVASDSHPPNTVVQEFNKGYLMGDRILRPARVVVAKGNATASKRKNGEGDAEDIEKP